MTQSLDSRRGITDIGPLFLIVFLCLTRVPRFIPTYFALVILRTTVPILTVIRDVSPHFYLDKWDCGPNSRAIHSSVS